MLAGPALHNLTTLDLRKRPYGSDTYGLDTYGLDTYGLNLWLGHLRLGHLWLGHLWLGHLDTYALPKPTVNVQSQRSKARAQNMECQHFQDTTIHKSNALIHLPSKTLTKSV